MNTTTTADAGRYTVFNAMVDIIAAPGRALDEVRQHPRWLWWPLLTLLVVTILAFVYYQNWVDFEWLVDEAVRGAIAQGTPADLRREILGCSTYELEVAGETPVISDLLVSVEPSLKITSESAPDATGFRHLTITTERDDELGEPLLQALASQNVRLRSLSRTNSTLEDVFLAATRRSWDVRSEDLRK